MKLIEFLDKSSAKYEVTQHPSTFSAQQMAEAEHVPGMEVAKPVVVKADRECYMCVLPACYKVDLNVLKKHLGLKQIELANENEMTNLFEDCDLGAEPPFSNLYGLVTFMDKTLETNEHIVFQSGTHKQAVRTTMAEYKRHVNPQILSFGYPGR